MVDVDSDLHHGIVDDDHIRSWVSLDICIREQGNEIRIHLCNDGQGIRDYCKDLGISEKTTIQKERKYIYCN